MITAYTQPTPAQFIDTYVPIPFEQLFKIGSMYKADYENSVNQLREFNKTYGSFDSQSSADTQSWYNETMGKIKPAIESLGTNSDLLKSAEGRAKLNATLNSVDYGKLAALRKSAEAMDQEQKIALQMQAQGKRINPDWYTPGYTSHSTIDPMTGKTNVYQAQAPMEYKDELETFNPYYSAVKPMYRRDKHGNPISRNGQFVSEITHADIARITSPENVKAMASDPLVQKHVATDLKYGRVPKEFLDEAGNIKDYMGYVAKKARESQEAKVGTYGRETDPFSLENLRFRHAQAGKQQQQQQSPTQRSHQLYRGVDEVLRNAVATKTVDKKTGVDVSNAVTSGDITRIMDYRFNKRNLINSVDAVPANTKDDKNELYSELSGGYKSNGKRGYRVLYSDDAMVSTKHSSKTVAAFQKAIEHGSFKNVIYKPTGDVRAHLWAGDKSNAPQVTNTFNKQYMYIPISQAVTYEDAIDNLGIEKVGDKNNGYYRVPVATPILNSSEENSDFDASHDKDMYGTSYTKDYNEEYIKRNTTTTR
jgi:hypothetical protein